MECSSGERAKELTKHKQWVSALAVSFGGVGVGLCLSWTATALPSIQETEEIRTLEGLTPLEKALIGSLLFAGALLGGPLTSYMKNVVGKKVSLLQLASVSFLGWITMGMATTPGHLYFGRLLTGIYVGGCSVVIPVYVKELASKENRGALGSLFLIMLSTGKFISNLVGILVSASHLSLLCALQPVIHVVILLFVPDSPEVRTLRRRRPTDSPSQTDAPKTPVVSIEEGYHDDQSVSSAGTSSTLPLGNIFLPVTTAFILSLLTQLSGTNVVTFFTTEMFPANFNIPTTASAITYADLAMVILAATQIAGGLPSSFLVNRCGPKTLLLSSLLVMTLSLAGLAGYYFFFAYPPQSQSEWNWMDILVPLAFLVIYFVSYCWGIGSVFWIVMEEILPPEISATVSSLANALCWISAFGVTFLYQLFSAPVPLYTWFSVFAIISFGGGLFVARFLPETKCQSLQEIQDRYNSGTREESDEI